jgi:A/G-specific adenine glycosylase
MVSEIMLQQTQVNRVIPKFQQFLAVFPTVTDLAEASLADVLRLWSGLGYNRRAKYLWQAAHKVVHEWQGAFPSDAKQLATLPGIGTNTAGAICAYAFNQPVVFIETNIRTVFIHHFFAGQTGVDDKEFRPLLEASLVGQEPRTFYWAVMDYGTFLKSQGNNIERSKQYVKQSAFQGSRRQIRGQILRELIKSGATYTCLKQKIADDRYEAIVAELIREGLVKRDRQNISLA